MIIVKGVEGVDFFDYGKSRRLFPASSRDGLRAMPSYGSCTEVHASSRGQCRGSFWVMRSPSFEDLPGSRTRALLCVKAI